jgi:SAM-dependent methyltransferase
MKEQEIWQLYCGRHPVIDIGCGWDILFNFEYVRFDIAVQILGQKTTVNHFGDFHDMSDFSDETFAFINADQVIEHAEFPRVALKEWIRILQVGGILHLCWPHLDVWDRQRIEDARDAVRRGDMQAYYALGGIDNWISVGQHGEKLLDVHWNKISMEEMKLMLPPNVVILAEYPGMSLILKKV